MPLLVTVRCVGKDLGVEIIETHDDDQALEFRRKVGERVLQARKHKGMDQLALARLAGYKSASSILAIEKGETNFTFDRLWTIAQVLEMPVLDLLIDNAWAGQERRGEYHEVLALLGTAAAGLPPAILESLRALIMAIYTSYPPNNFTGHHCMPSEA